MRGVFFWLIRQRRRLQFLQKGITRHRQPLLQPAARCQHAGTAIGAETFDYRLVALEGAHHLAQRDRARWPGEAEASTGVAPRFHDACDGQLAYHLRQVMT